MGQGSFPIDQSRGFTDSPNSLAPFSKPCLGESANYTLSRLITLFGIKPIAPVQWCRETFWLYGAVAPTSGEHFFYEFSHLDSTCFQQFIDLFAAA
jgi:hypothetical protein